MKNTPPNFNTAVSALLPNLMKSLLSSLLLAGAAFSQTTVVEESFTYADGLVNTVGTGGTGWNATEGGWQAGNSVSTTNRFVVETNQAIYKGGGSSTYTRQNRSFASALTSNTAQTIAVKFTLIRPETQSGRGIGIYLTNGGTELLFIGKRTNSTVGLHSGIAIPDTTLRSFATSGSPEPITATITYDGTNTSVVLSDSNETLAAHSVAGTFTFDGISLAGYNSATLANGIDDISVTVEVVDPRIIVNTASVNFGTFANNPGPQTQTFTITNLGATQGLDVSSLGVTGSSAFTATSPASLPFTVPAGGSQLVEVTFDPGGAGGRFDATLTILSNDYNGAEPTVPLTAFVDPAGTVVARYDFDPNGVSDTTVDLNGSAQTDWTTTLLLDEATGIGAVSVGNQDVNNRAIAAGKNGNYLNFSSNREGDTQTPLASGGDDESTWTTFTVSPDAGGGAINFTGGFAVIDTYANINLTTPNNTAADWTLYYSINGGTTWTSLGTQAGQATAVNGTFGPLGLTWDLSPIGNVTSAVDFILDPVATGGTNGTVGQRGVGFDNLVITASSVTPGTVGTFASWASGFSIPNNPDYDGTDNDGIPALVEYALGLSPLMAESLANTYNPATRELSLTKGTEAVSNGDVTYAIETSQTLTSWDTTTPDTDSPTLISYTLPAGQGKWFARLVVTQVVP